MIVWFMDRFGLPGHYHVTWVRMLRDNYIPTDEVRVVQLHKLLAPKQLLTKLGSRKAPTWVPDEGMAITSKIDEVIAALKPRAVILSSPESLACLALAPEHATLHNLRGSVYWRSGVPHLVMLPMSAWFSMVTQKEIGGANYGFESQESFARARQQGEVPAEEDPPRLGGAESAGPINPARNPSGAARGYTGNQLVGTETREQRPANESGPAAISAPASQAQNPARLPSGNLGSWHNIGAVHAGVLQPSHGGGTEPDGNLPATDSDRFGHAEDAIRRSEDEPPGFLDGSVEDDDADSEEGTPGDGDHGLDPGDDSLPEDGGDDAESSDGLDEPDREEGEMDAFFYEPVLSPVGRFVLTADTQKLFRLLRDGKDAAGPSRPIEVHWR